MPTLMTYCSLRHLRQRSKFCTRTWIRSLYSQTGEWDEPNFNADLLKKIEAHWKPILQKRKLDRFKDAGQTDRPKYYVLSMFPYPSGNLHMGHVRVYTISDVMARFQEMKGKQVIQPMGWDAFGLPAENAAIERGVSPEKWTKSNINVMKLQLQDMCCSFDWDKELATCDPEYYKWTQYIFLKMYEAGLAYQQEGVVNWDPVDNTVLANEQIDERGCSWRSGAKVEKRYLRQWFLRTTAYSKSLLDGLSEVEPDLWQDVITLQKEWIGECNGCNIDFQFINNGELMGDPVSIFTYSPELIYGVSHIALAPSHRYNAQQYYKESSSSSDKDILLSIEAIHPLTNQTIPVIVSKTTEWDGFNEAKLAQPDVCENDAALASKFGIKWTSVLDVVNEGQQLTNSQQLDGLSREEGFEKALLLAQEKGIGGYLTSARLKDWLISRQRYWGTPIPIIHCPSCKAVPVPYEDLPVKLPVISASTDRKTSLKQDENWIKTVCPRCGGEARRETDTMDTFVDSSWYFLRYLDVNNESAPFSKEKVDEYMPVDLYVGGKEHAVLHLFYARFFNHFLYNQGLLSHREPFYNLLTQGMVMSQSYRTKADGKYLRPEQVDLSGPKPVEKGTGAELIVEWEKMSKSKYNGADPQEFIQQYGVDSTRMCIVAGAKPSSSRNWSKELYVGTLRWQTAVWKLAGNYIKVKNNSKISVSDEELQKMEENIRHARNLCVFKASVALEHLFNTGEVIGRLHSFINSLKKVPDDVQQHSQEFERALTDLILITAPFTPNFAEELFMALSSVGTHPNYEWGRSVFDQSWPETDLDYVVNVTIQRNRGEFSSMNMDLGTVQTASILEVIQLCRQQELFQKFIEPIYKDCDINLQLHKLTVNFNVPYDPDSELEKEYFKFNRLRKEAEKKQKKKREKEKNV